MKDGVDIGIEQLEGALDGLVLAAQDEAEKACEPFWRKSQEIRGSGAHPKKWFKYGVSVRPEPTQSGATRVRVVWLELNWIKMRTPTGGSEWKLRGSYIRTNRYGKYTIAMFKKAGAEEKELIRATLEELEKIYDTLKLVGSLRKSISNTYRKYRNT